MKRHPITEPPKRNGRYMVGTEHTVYIADFYVAHFGPWILDSNGRAPGEPLTWWANLPKPGLHPGRKPK